MIPLTDYVPDDPAEAKARIAFVIAVFNVYFMLIQRFPYPPLYAL
jgi:hypothetical protein